MGFKGSNFKRLGKMAKRLDRLRPKCAPCSDGSGNGHRLKNIGPVRHRREHFNPRLTGGNIRGFKGSTFHRKSGYDLPKKITIIYNKIKLINITMLQPSRAKPGNPEL